MRTKSDSDLRLIKVLAGASGLIGITGLILLLTTGAWATPPPAPGFERGNQNFNNPFAAPSGESGAGFFDESIDEEEEEDLSFPAEGANAPRGGIEGFGRAGGQPIGEQGPNITRDNRGVQVGGGNPGGVVQGNDLPPLPVNSETGGGSQEVITDFNFPDADILDIAKALGKLTGKNFILDKDVKGRITIISNSPITVGDAWRAFLTALDINGYAIIPSGKYIRIARQRDARDKQLNTYSGSKSPNTDALITRVFPLKYLSAEEVARNFRSFMPANSRIIPYEQTNTVIVTDTGSNIQKLQRLLEILDVEGFDAGIEVIPVKHASAVELSKLIDQLVPGNPTTSRTGVRPSAARGSQNFTARRTKEGGIINTIIADERTNTLIVHANSRGADQIRELVAKLDQKIPATQGGGKIHVVYLQFADAEQIAQTLNNLGQQAQQTSPIRTAGRGGSGTGTNPVQASLFEGSIRVSPDKATNSLVITASPNDFSTVQRVINRLDIPRDQVYAEVIIMEMNLNRDFNFSANIASPTNGIAITPNTDLLEFLQNPIGARGATLGFKSQGTRDFNIGGTTVPIPNVSALIRTLQTKSNANVLATPQILALDNTEATFETAELIPFPTSTAVQGAGVSTSVSKERVQLSIKLKPQINKAVNMVKLDIETKLQDISGREVPAQVQGLAFATLERAAKTSILVADGDTVVLGGLVRDNDQEQVSKVPILGDIPVLGWLFKSKRTQRQKTNLLVFITPTIVRQYEAVRKILDRKLKERDDFIEQATGGVDEHRQYRNNIIRSLPDVKEVLSKKPERVVTIGDSSEPEGPGVGTLGGGSSQLSEPEPEFEPPLDGSVPPADPGEFPQTEEFEPAPPPPMDGEFPPPAEFNESFD